MYICGRHEHVYVCLWKTCAHATQTHTHSHFCAWELVSVFFDSAKDDLEYLMYTLPSKIILS